jgi:hypothetical protein
MLFNAVQRCSTPFNAVQHRSTPFNAVQGCSTLFKLVQACSTGSTHFKLVQQIAIVFNTFLIVRSTPSVQCTVMQNKLLARLKGKRKTF